ncbi:enoyl-CoA hydratase-related protein [Bradyrhizobium sp. LMG 9283]|uniref:enoyl-CoA hydratase-related protein n=1 Tax=Bradyrhizobium sp. LMG 9283 TaxID=592064 RepID=UPI00388EEE70
MSDILEAFRGNAGVAVLRSPNDNCFCAGWLLEVAAASEAPRASAVNEDHSFGSFGGVRELRDHKKPVIARVDGCQFGSGRGGPAPSPKSAIRSGLEDSVRQDAQEGEQ